MYTKLMLSLDESIFVTYLNDLNKIIGYDDLTSASMIDYNPRNIFRAFNDMKYNSDEESQVIIMGKKMNIPRQQIAFGETDINFHFAGTNAVSKNWSLEKNPLGSEYYDVCRYIRFFKKVIDRYFGINFNYVLINKYKDGESYIGYHSDGEKDFKPDTPIVGISLGEPRLLVLKHKSEKYKNRTRKLLLENNSLYCMYCPTNKMWKHSIPKDKTKRPRISLTFRQLAV